MNHRASLLLSLLRTARGAMVLAASGCVPDAIPHEDPPLCGIAFSSECGRCAEADCCSEARACAESPGCKLAADCLAACEGDAECRTKCTVEHPGNDSVEAAELAACLTRDCEDSCGLTCGALPGLVSPAAAESCQTCLTNNHCKEQLDCAKNADCQLYVACRQACVTGDCIGSCALRRDPEADVCLGECDNDYCVRPCSSDFNEVVDLYGALYTSVGGDECWEQCQAGGDWSCVGQFEWPRREEKNRMLTVGFSPHFGTASRQGILVKMCKRGDQQCSPGVDSAYTDENGIVHLLDTTGPETNGPGFGLNGFLSVSSDEIYPTNVYWGFPLSKANGALGNSIPIFEKGVSFVGDGDHGTIAAIVVDCAGVPAKAVEVALEPGGPVVQRLYAKDGELTADKNTPHTDLTGSVFFTQVPPGQQTLIVTPLATGSVSSRVTVDVEPGMLTEVGLGPTPQ